MMLLFLRKVLLNRALRDEETELVDVSKLGGHRIF